MPSRDLVVVAGLDKIALLRAVGPDVVPLVQIPITARTGVHTLRRVLSGLLATPGTNRVLLWMRPDSPLSEVAEPVLDSVVEVATAAEVVLVELPDLDALVQGADLPLYDDPPWARRTAAIGPNPDEIRRSRWSHPPGPIRTAAKRQETQDNGCL